MIVRSRDESPRRRGFERQRELRGRHLRLRIVNTTSLEGHAP